MKYQINAYNTETKQFVYIYCKGLKATTETARSMTQPLWQDVQVRKPNGLSVIIGG